jgi:lipopolysaccharide/colanic/teichoic acid biosynthesis glycosyltransferase
MLLEAAAVVRESERSSYYGVKRAIDLTLAGLLLIALAPLMVAVAVLVILDTPGGALYVDERIGSRRRVIDGRVVWELRPFRLYKFRSMLARADSSPHEAHIRAFVTGTLDPVEGSKAAFKLNGDARITRAGRILRRTSIDELPQLLNVIRGEMSLVGPRPLPPYEVALYEEQHLRRFGALPGITGLWQVSGRCAVPFEQMHVLDSLYVERQSLRLDLKILLRTIPAVLLGVGAS